MGNWESLDLMIKVVTNMLTIDENGLIFVLIIDDTNMIEKKFWLVMFIEWVNFL